MTEILLYAVPVFVLLLGLEVLSYRFAPDDDERGYELRDTVTSLSMGVGSLVVGAAWKLSIVVLYGVAFTLTPLRIPMDTVWAWGLLFLADDFAYYWFHRLHHEWRVLWASHVVHHSSQNYNFSTALRQTWVPFTLTPFWLPLALLGFPVWAILLQQSISLIYQFFLHTERIDRMPRWYEAVMNTPSHHRVHHGSNAQYLDRNYGGILIVWDRLFRTFEPEGERVRYGLTTNIETFNPVKVAFAEYVALGLDVVRARSWSDRLRHLVKGPGWQPGAAA